MQPVILNEYEHLNVSFSSIALDHDMTKTSLTPSVILQCRFPDRTLLSEVKLQYMSLIVFQSSSPFRNAVSIIKLLEQEENVI